MKITEKEVDYVARLARLHVQESQMQRLTQDMGNIIAFADKLGELDTEQVEPAAHSIVVENVLRADEVQPSYAREDIIANAPHQTGRLFLGAENRRIERTEQTWSY